MSKSAILKSSIAKKWWMALTGLFLCLFLVGHLLGNLQLLKGGVEGQRAFNEYAYFMTHNIFIKVLSYATYISILFHAIDGIMLTIQNKKARPVQYAYNKPGTNSSLPSRYMAILGTMILVFIAVHMANFWARMHFEEGFPLFKVVQIEEKVANENPYASSEAAATMDTTELYLTTNGSYLSGEYFSKDGFYGENPPLKLEETHLVDSKTGLRQFELYKDLHSATMAFFGHDKMKEAGLPANKLAWLAVLGYVLAMAALAFHLWHGFASAFQTLGLKNEKYTPLISGIGKVFAVVVPLAFAVIPVFIFLTK